MDDFFFNELPAKNRGLRLQKLEVYNWGTFDSSRGEIHVIRPAGQSTLLVGRNGSGKSTLVDALLTLLVRPVVRNYNVAAGASKQERDERSYLKGAYGRFSRDEDNRADIHYLRPEGSKYSALLAHFHNADTKEGFTIAQVLYLNSEGRADKMYCFADGERSILADLAGLTGMEKLKQQLQKRGFKATHSFSEFHTWFAKATGVQPKAMDMFNQTVAVKDIQSLNRFIRDHMLEAKPWEEKVEELLNHFIQLSEAHRSLVAVRKQAELLEPVAEKGNAYRQQSGQLDEITRLLEAAESYFRLKTIDLFTPECETRRQELEHTQLRKNQLAAEIDEILEECRRIKNEIDNAGGDRFKQIPFLIRHEATQSAAKKDADRRYYEALLAAGSSQQADDEAGFQANRQWLTKTVVELERDIADNDRKRVELAVERNQVAKELDENEQELRALEQRKGNVPQTFVDVRRQMCQNLGLSEKDVPFVAELLVVKPEERAWESSVEMVLRSFALSLLVPQRHYRLVSSYIEKTRLADARGSGQKIVYLSVGKRANEAAGPITHPQSLLRKLNYQEGNPLLPWVKAELEERFDYRCCETIEEFQAAADFAMTRGRHVKSRGARHEKDDRERSANPRFYVLGWDNEEKRRRLAEEVRRLRDVLGQLDQSIERLAATTAKLRQRLTGAHLALEFSSFAAINYAVHDTEIVALELEKKRLEENNQVVKTLKARLGQAESRHVAQMALRDEVVGRERELKNEIESGERLIQNAQRELKKLEKDESFARHRESYEKLDSCFEKQPLLAATLLAQERAFKDTQRAAADRLRRVLDPLHDDLCSAMNRFLREFTNERTDLEAKIDFLDSFLGLRERIVEEDLPRHEQRFKERLNENVIRDVGVLNANFGQEKSNIIESIEKLNKSLGQLDYRAGTFMKLEPRIVRDPEIIEFQASLKGCLEGTFEGTPEADEACFVRIEKFVTRLREPGRWREKVTDVRRWFDFAAREIVRDTGKECGYYEDSAGQSGGEKAKLAFTILVAAIAYQYGIDPTQAKSDRFHFVVVDEMFSKVDDQYAEYALELFKRFGLQLLIVAPLDAKARITEPYVGCYAHVLKNEQTFHSEIFTMTAREFQETVIDAMDDHAAPHFALRPERKPR